MNQLLPTELNREQRRHLEDARELWDVWAPLAKRRDDLTGAIAWKTVKGREYLVRYWQDQDTGEKRMSSLGPRSSETEKAKADFDRDRGEVDKALANLKGRFDGLARVGRALRLGRLERTLADVLRQLWKSDLLGSDLMIIGSAAIHLYEASAGVLVPNAVLPERDLDLVAVNRSTIDADDLLRVLQRADKTFRVGSGALSFVNYGAFRVDILSLQQMRSFFSDMRELSTLQHRAINAGLDLPPVQAIGVARDGLPVPMIGIDPRTFAILKYARAEFDHQRGRNAAEIDRDQALVVATLVNRYWRRGFEPEWLEAFPGLAKALGTASPEDEGPRFFM